MCNRHFFRSDIVSLSYITCFSFCLGNSLLANSQLIAVAASYLTMRARPSNNNTVVWSVSFCPPSRLAGGDRSNLAKVDTIICKRVKASAKVLKNNSRLTSAIESSLRLFATTQLFPKPTERRQRRPPGKQQPKIKNLKI